MDKPWIVSKFCFLSRKFNFTHFVFEHFSILSTTTKNIGEEFRSLKLLMSPMYKNLFFNGRSKSILNLILNNNLT